jgi:crotonobetainyl-CoA:carnitine CoA-transferase CaiB-like acyl-CoA transferase
MVAREALTHVWSLVNGEPTALERVSLTGGGPGLPSSFSVGALAQATIAASALAAAEMHRLRTGRDQKVSVDLRAACAEFRSERHVKVPGTDRRLWDRVAGLYQTGDGRYVRLHTNFPHHRSGMLAMLGAEYDRDSVAKALSRWKGEDFETAAAANGLVATMTRSPEEWRAHGQGQALAALPLLEIDKIGEAPPRERKAAGRPLSDIRVLDLTRVIAGPVCGRALAAHGADVLAISSPTLPQFSDLVMDMGRGKRAAHVDLATPEGRETLAGLARTADVFVQGFRPGAIAAHGFAPEAVAALSPGVVCVSLSAYGRSGPWSGRRGFDSLVQNANGLNHAEGVAAGNAGGRPKELPCQALDHGAGFLMATGAMAALKRQAEEGGSWLVRVSLAQVGAWLLSMPRVPDGLAAHDPTIEEGSDLIESSQSGFGPMQALRHSAEMSLTSPRWELPSMPFGTHQPVWAA